MNSRVRRRDARNAATRDTLSLSIHPTPFSADRQTGEQGVWSSADKNSSPNSVCALRVHTMLVSLGALNRVSERLFSHIRLINVPLFFTLGSRPFAAVA